MKNMIYENEGKKMAVFDNLYMYGEPDTFRSSYSGRFEPSYQGEFLKKGDTNGNNFSREVIYRGYFHEAKTKEESKFDRYRFNFIWEQDPRRRLANVLLTYFNVRDSRHEEIFGISFYPHFR